MPQRQTNKKFVMRGVSCHLYKRKGVRSCPLMRQVNRLYVVDETTFLGRIPNFDYAISEKVFRTIY